jgi:hypothetical protein
MRPKQGPGAAGARPLSRHTTRVPSRVGCGGPGFLGVKIFPGGSLFTLLCPYLPRVPHRFFPVCPLFSIPWFSLYKFSPQIFSIYPHFSYIYKIFPRGGPIYCLARGRGSARRPGAVRRT